MKNIPFLAAFLMCLTFGFSQGKMTDIAKKNKDVQFEYTAAKTNKVMGMLSSKLAGKADGKLIAVFTKEALAKL